MLWLDDAVKNIKSPLDYNYIKLLRFNLMLVGYWPRKEVGEEEKWYHSLVYFYTLTVKIICLILIIGYLLAQQKILTFLEIGHLYITTVMNSLSLIRTIIMPKNPKYKRLIGNFIQKIHLFHHKYDSDYSMQWHKRLHMYSHYYTYFICTQMISGLTLFNIVPHFWNISEGRTQHKNLYNDTYELSIYYLYPSDCTTNRNSYIYVSFFNWYISYVCCNVVCMVDMLVLIIVSHGWGHYKILLNKLYTFPRPAEEALQNTNVEYDSIMFSPEESIKVLDNVKECINYHRYIAKFTNDMSDTFGPMLLIYYTFNLVSICVLLLLCSQMTLDALLRFGILLAVILQALIQLSVAFELVKTASENLSDAVYNIPWECMNTASRKTVLFFLMISQKPVNVKALGLAEVGITTMASVLKTSFSYFAFLKTVENQK